MDVSTHHWCLSACLDCTAGSAIIVEGGETAIQCEIIIDSVTISLHCGQQIRVLWGHEPLPCNAPHGTVCGSRIFIHLVLVLDLVEQNRTEV